MCAVPQCVGYVCPLSLEEQCLGLVASTVDLMVRVCFKLQSTKLMRSMINHLPFLLWAFLNLLHVGNKTDFCFLEMNTGRGKKRAVIKVTDPWKQIKQNMLYFPIQEKQIYLWWSNPKEASCGWMFRIFDNILQVSALVSFKGLPSIIPFYTVCLLKNFWHCVQEWVSVFVWSSIGNTVLCVISLQVYEFKRWRTLSNYFITK